MNCCGPHNVLLVMLSQAFYMDLLAFICQTEFVTGCQGYCLDTKLLNMRLRSHAAMPCECHLSLQPASELELVCIASQHRINCSCSEQHTAHPFALQAGTKAAEPVQHSACTQPADKEFLHPQQAACPQYKVNWALCSISYLPPAVEPKQPDHAHSLSSSFACMSQHATGSKT